jgi:ABC-type sugar transport system ATPase subunit
MDVLTTEGLTKRFGPAMANDAVDLRVRAGELVGLPGHHGAGKTTLISQIVGPLRADAGRIRVPVSDAVANPAAARPSVALQAQREAPLDGLTARRVIELAARIRGLNRSAAAARVGHEPAARMAPQSRCATGGTGAFKTIAELVQLPVRSITTPPGRPSCPTRGGHRCLCRQRAAAGPARSPVTTSRSRPSTNREQRKVRQGQGIERMPKSAAMPKSQVSSRELSELSRIKAN